MAHIHENLTRKDILLIRESFLISEMSTIEYKCKQENEIGRYLFELK